MINNCDMIYSFVHLACTILNVRHLLIVDFFVHLCPLNIIDTPTRNGKAREHKARVWVNTILGVASSTNYYFTRRSYTSSARILFYRDIIVELECHGVTPPRSFRFAERMSPTFRYFAIQEDLVNLRDGGFFVPFLPRGKKKETIALSVDGKVDDLYWFISLLLIKSGKIYWRFFFFLSY